MRPGLVFRAALALVLAAFLIAPSSFAPVFRPFTQNDAPPIYLQADLLGLAAQHALLVVLAVAVGCVISIGLGILVTRPSGREFLPMSRAIANIGQTFPPIAVLALTVPALGFGPAPTFVALLLYGLLPIFENTLTGLSSVDRSVAEAARGSGMTDRQTLFQVELPLALPLILAGIRISTVISISTATIGSTVAARTLGEVIIAGLQSNNPAFILQGGLVVGAMAILTHDAFTWAEKAAARRAGRRVA
ncbi:MAG: ABC transporter permease [Pseudomonadota bacterium]